MTPPIFVTLRQFADSAPEIVDMFRFRKNAVACADAQRTLLARGVVMDCEVVVVEPRRVRVWVQRFEAVGKKRRRHART